MITLRRYMDPNRAYVDQAVLKAAGVRSHLSGENAALLGSAAVGLPELQLLVHPSDAAEAHAILTGAELPRAIPTPESEPDESASAMEESASTPRPWWQIGLFYFVVSSLLAAAFSLALGASPEAWIELWALAVLALIILRGGFSLLRSPNSRG